MLENVNVERPTLIVRIFGSLAGGALFGWVLGGEKE